MTPPVWRMLRMANGPCQFGGGNWLYAVPSRVVRCIGIGIATDHGGFGLKEERLTHLRAAGHEVVDFVAYRLDPNDDYPDFVIPLARAVAAGGPGYRVLPASQLDIPDVIRSSRLPRRT